MPRVTSIECVPYEGWLYSLEVEEDHSFIANGLVVHNCETPVNQDAKFTVISKSFDEAGEFAQSAYCKDCQCPITPAEATKVLKSAVKPSTSKPPVGTGQVSIPKVASSIKPATSITPGSSTNQIVPDPTIAPIAKGLVDTSLSANDAAKQDNPRQRDVYGEPTDPRALKLIDKEMKKNTWEVAGMAVVAKDTGRVLMLQRAVLDNDDDPAAGTWEFPGGHIDPGEKPLAAAKREWAEEVGLPLPKGNRVSEWFSDDGIYVGFVVEIPSEGLIPFGERDHITNPDDPDGDKLEAIAWWDPSHVEGNPALREELKGQVGDALEGLTEKTEGNPAARSTDYYRPDDTLEKVDEFDEGLESESSEHYDSVHGDVDTLANIVRDHLKEDPKYYSGDKKAPVDPADPTKMLRKAGTDLPAKVEGNGALYSTHPAPVDGVGPTAPLSDPKDEVQYLNLAASNQNSSNTAPLFGIPDDSGYKFITGDDDPREPEMQDKKRVPLLSHADYYPGVLKGARRTLTLAVNSLGDADLIEAAIYLAEGLDSGDASLWWEEGIGKGLGDFNYRGIYLSGLFSDIAKAAREDGNGRLLVASDLISKRLSMTAPLRSSDARRELSRLQKMATSLGIPCDSSSIIMKADGFEALLRLTNQISDIALDIDSRRLLDPTVLAAVDVLKEDAETVLDGLRLGQMSSEDPEFDIIKESHAEETIDDVKNADALLETVSKSGGLAGKRDVNYRAAVDSKRCETCVFFMEAGGPCKRVEAPIEPDMVCDMHSLGDGLNKGDTIEIAGENGDLVDNALEEKGGPENLPGDFRQRTIEAEEDTLKKAINEPAREKGGLVTPTYPNDDERNDVQTPHGFDERHYVESGQPKKDYPGMMIAWFPDSGQARQLQQEGGEKPDSLHVTVIYLSDADNYPDEKKEAIKGAIRRVVIPTQPMQGSISGVAKFNPSKGSDGKVPVVALVDVPGLSEFRSKLMDELRAEGIEPPMDHGFTPHITVRYDKPGMDDMQSRGIPAVETTPISIDKVWLVDGNRRTEFSFDKGITQVSGKNPDDFANKLKASDEDARNYVQIFQRMWNRGFNDSRYRLALVKDEGGNHNILEID